MKRPLSSRYDPKAQDGDGDSFVQDSTPWERPVFISLIPTATQMPTNQQLAGSRSSTAPSAITEFVSPVQLGNKNIVSYIDIQNTDITPFAQSVLQTYLNPDSSKMDRKNLNGLEIIEIKGLATFPNYSLVTGIEVSGRTKQRSSALVSMIPFNQASDVSIFSIHIPEEAAQSIMKLGTKPTTIMERLGQASEKTINRIDSTMALQHLDIPETQTTVDNITQLLLSRNIPSHARPLLVSFIDDAHEDFDNAAVAIPVAKSISIWDNPNAKRLHARIIILSHEIGHLLDVVPSGYSSLGGNWKAFLAQEDLPSRFSLSRAYADAMVKDFIFNQSRRLDSSDLEQYHLSRITPEMTRVTDYATSYEDQDVGMQEDFAEAFSLFLMSELLGVLGNKQTGMGEEYNFASLFPNRHKFFNQLLESFGIESINSISGSKSTTRPRLIAPRININSLDFPQVQHGNWMSSAPVIGPGRILPSRFIDENTSLGALRAMGLMRQDPSMQNSVVRWMLGLLTKPTTGIDAMDHAEYIDSLDRLLDLAPQINVGTMFRAFDHNDPSILLESIKNGNTVMFRASSVSFSPNEAFTQADRASQAVGLSGTSKSRQRVLFAIPRTARGVIYDDSRVDPEKWKDGPTEAIVRGRFKISSVKKKANITLVELSELNEVHNDGVSFMYTSMDEKIKPGSLIRYNNSLAPAAFSPVLVSDASGKYENPIPGSKSQTSGEFLFEVDPTRTVVPTDEPMIDSMGNASASGKVVASYRMTDFGDALSFGERSAPAGSKSSTKYALDSRFLDEGVFLEEDPKSRERMFRVFNELGLDYEAVTQLVRAVIASRRQELGDRKFKKEIKSALQWYPRIRKGLVTLNKDLNALQQVSGRKKFANEEIFAMMAALSPLEKVSSNVKKVNVVASTIARDADFSVTIPLGGVSGMRMSDDLARWIKTMEDKIITPSKFIDLFVSEFGAASKSNAVALLARVHPDLFASKGPVGVANVIKALMIGYRVDSIDNILSGLKVRSFYLNFVNPAGPNVTIDTWMYRVMVPSTSVFTVTIKGVTHIGTLRELQTKLAKDFSVQSLFQSNRIDKMPVGVYPIFAQIVRDLAREFADDFPEFGTMTPAAMQAFLWEISRTTWSSEKPTQWERVEEWFRLQ